MRKYEQENSSDINLEDYLGEYEDKQATVEDKIQEIRLVNKAKWALIQCLGMTEEEAHRHIEKRAMDERLTRREVASRILSTYSHTST